MLRAGDISDALLAPAGDLLPDPRRASRSSCRSFPLHTWLPDAHTDAPTAVSVILAGVLLKMGGYGMIRILVGILPDSAQDYDVCLASLAALSVIYGAILTLRQTRPQAPDRLLQRQPHGLRAARRRGAGRGRPHRRVAADVHARHDHRPALRHGRPDLRPHAHTRNIRRPVGPRALTCPSIATVFVIAGLASLGLPTMSGFVAELIVFLGSRALRGTDDPRGDRHPALGRLHPLDGAARVLRPEGRALGGPAGHDAWWEQLPGGGVVAVIIAVGIYPATSSTCSRRVSSRSRSGLGVAMLDDLDRIGPVLVMLVAAGRSCCWDLVLRERDRRLAAVRSPRGARLRRRSGPCR